MNWHGKGLFYRLYVSVITKELGECIKGLGSKWCIARGCVNNLGVFTVHPFLALSYGFVFGGAVVSIDVGRPSTTGLIQLMVFNSKVFNSVGRRNTCKRGIFNPAA